MPPGRCTVKGTTGGVVLDNASPKLRSDLIVRAETEGAQAVYVIKDPLTGRFFRLRAPEYYLLSRADGVTPLAEAVRLTNERFGIQIPPAMAAAFFEKMERMLFFENPATEQVLSRLGTRSSMGHKSIWLIPLKAFDPDRMVSRWARRLRFLFNPYAVGVATMVMAGAGALAAAQSHVWGAGLPEIFRVTSLPLFVVAVMTLAFVHEFGHALTLKYYGGSVREMGFLLLYFQPAFYCNISDSYLLPGRWPRMVVGLAGLFFQGVATALAIVAWRLLEPGTIIAQFLWVFVAVSLAIFLFNLNPLIKLDGYYILVDWLRLPNLRAKAYAYWRGLLRRWVWGQGDGAHAIGRRERRIFIWYGLLSALFTTALVLWIGYWITQWLHGRWGVAGIVLGWGTVIVLAFALRSTGGTAARADAAAEDRTEEASRRRWLRPVLFWGILALVILALAVIPAERRVGSPCEVEASSRFVVTSPVGGTLETMLIEGADSSAALVEHHARSILQATASDFSVVAYEINVREGERVDRGDTLVLLSSNLYLATLAATEARRDRVTAERNLLLSGPKQDAIKELRAEIQEATATVQNREVELQRMKMMYERNLVAEKDYEKAKTELDVAKAQKQGKNSKLALLISEPKAEELAIKEAELASLEAEIDFLRTQIAASTVLSPITGEAARVERGGILAEVADLDPVRLHLLVHENDIADVRVGAPVSLKVRSLPFDTFRGHVARIADLADTLGEGRRFLVVTELPNPDGRLKPGMSGFAKIDCGQRSLLGLMTRQAVQFFRVEFWSWW